MAAGDDFPEKQFGNFIMAENLLIESGNLTHDMLFGAYFSNLYLVGLRALE